MSKGHKVFTYGTLMRGQGNHKYFLEWSKFMGDATTVEKFALFTGQFPRMADPRQVDRAVAPASRGALDALAGRVRGELFRVDEPTLARLDGLEDVPRHYTRERIAIRMDKSGKITSAWVYLIVGPARYLGALDMLMPGASGAMKWDETTRTNSLVAARVAARAVVAP